MKYGIHIVATLLLLSNSSMFADTRNQQLTKAFDDSYRALFPKQGNIIELKKTNPIPLKNAMQSITAYAQQISNKFNSVLNDLNSAANNIIAILTTLEQYYPSEWVMLTTPVWDYILNDLVTPKGSNAYTAIQSASKTIRNMSTMLKKVDEIEIAFLLSHIIEHFQTTGERIYYDLLSARENAKWQAFNAHQAEEKGKLVDAIFHDNKLDDNAKWTEIMNLIGLYPKGGSLTNYNLALKKFHIDPDKPIETGLRFQSKSNVYRALNTLFYGRPTTE